MTKILPILSIIVLFILSYIAFLRVEASKINDADTSLSGIKETLDEYRQDNEDLTHQNESLTQIIVALDGSDVDLESVLPGNLYVLVEELTSDTEKADTKEDEVDLSR